MSLAGFPHTIVLSHIVLICASYRRGSVCGVEWSYGVAISQDIPMFRPMILSLILASTALVCAAESASAQSPYSYPWCSRQPVHEGATTSCYFTSYQQCMTTISGIGGWCYQNPAYYAASGYGQVTAKPLRPRHH
jgi:hypothetical protein